MQHWDNPSVIFKAHLLLSFFLSMSPRKQQRNIQSTDFFSCWWASQALEPICKAKIRAGHGWQSYSAQGRSKEFFFPLTLYFFAILWKMLRRKLQPLKWQKLESLFLILCFSVTSLFVSSLFYIMQKFLLIQLLPQSLQTQR